MNYTNQQTYQYPCSSRSDWVIIVRDDGTTVGYYPLSNLPDWHTNHYTLTDEEMAGLTSRNKGKRGEREVVKLMQPAVNVIYEHMGMEPPVLERNQMQSNNGGYDIVGLDWMALEVKFQEQLNLKKWWEQTTKQAQNGQMPVLFYRQSRKPWRVRMLAPLDLQAPGYENIPTVVDVSSEDFIEFMKWKLYCHLMAAKEKLDAQGESS